MKVFGFFVDTFPFFTKASSRQDEQPELWTSTCSQPVLISVHNFSEKENSQNRCSFFHFLKDAEVTKSCCFRYIGLLYESFMLAHRKVAPT